MYESAFTLKDIDIDVCVIGKKSWRVLLAKMFQPFPNAIESNAYLRFHGSCDLVPVIDQLQMIIIVFREQKEKK